MNATPATTPTSSTTKSIKQLGREILPLLTENSEQSLLQLYASVANNKTHSFSVSRDYIAAHIGLSAEIVRQVNLLFKAWGILVWSLKPTNTNRHYTEFTFNRPRLEELATQGKLFGEYLTKNPKGRDYWTPDGMVHLNVLRAALKEVRSKGNNAIFTHLTTSHDRYFSDTETEVATVDTDVHGDVDTGGNGEVATPNEKGSNPKWDSEQSQIEGGATPDEKGSNPKSDLLVSSSSQSSDSKSSPLKSCHSLKAVEATAEQFFKVSEVPSQKQYEHKDTGHNAKAEPAPPVAKPLPLAPNENVNNTRGYELRRAVRDMRQRVYRRGEHLLKPRLEALEAELEDFELEIALEDTFGKFNPQSMNAATMGAQ